MQNKQTRSLLRPEKNVAKVKLHCVIPKSVDLWWAQKENALSHEFKNMPDYVLENNEKTYYLRNNQSKHMRALVFDQNKQIIINTTSLVIDFFADQPLMLEFEQFGRNDKMLAKFSQESGIVFAKVKIESDVSGNRIYDVNNSKKIKLIERVKISPLYQTKYLHHENLAEFYIVDGSNSFRVKVNSTLTANLNHLADINTIEMSPQEEGVVEIIVEDLGVEVLETASATLLVSDVSKIELIGGGLIEQGNSMNLTIKVYDSEGKPFAKDQLKYIDIKGEIEKQGSPTREGLDLHRINDDTFTAHGIISGNYRATVVACKRKGNNERITSNFVRIQVFDIVKIVPESILLFPGARWTIQVEGGPSGGSRGGVYREYHIDDPKICEIDEYGEVHAKHVGETWLRLDMYYKSNSKSLLASRKIQVRVALITAIEIPMMNERSVFVNSVTRLNVKLKHEKETFLHAIGPLSYDWSSSTSHIYSLSLPSKKDVIGGGSSLSLAVSKAHIWNGMEKKYDEFTTNFNYSSIVGVAQKNGDARISVKMSVEYPEEYSKEQNFFYNTIRIKVTDKLTMEVPEFIEYPTQEPHIYILPPLARNKIVTNKDAKVSLAYSVQTGIHYDKGYDCMKTGDEVIFTKPEKDHNIYEENPILKIMDKGYVQTLDKYGKATIIIEENNSLENQLVMLNIMVSQIYSLSIEKPYTALNLPMGSETSLKVTLQEENARSFANQIEGVDLFIENSHPHIVQATLENYNSSLSLNALGIGEANIRVFTKDNVFDVIRVKVLSSVLPHSPVQLHIGGQVEFIFADNQTPANTKWHTEHTDILSVDPVYGSTVGRKEGQGEVKITSNSISLASMVHVKKVDRIELDSNSKPEFFTTVHTNKYFKDEYQLLLNVYLEDGLSEVYPEMIIKGKPLIKHNIKITCESEASNFAIIYSKVINNRYACVIRPRPEEKSTTSIPNSLRILVRATSDNSMSYKTEETFEIPFVSFFYVNYPTRDLKFYADQRFKSIQVISNTDFSVHVEGNSDLVNYKIDENSDRNNYEVQFSVPSSVKNDFKELKVRISNPLADQSETFYLSFYRNPKSSYAHREETERIYIRDDDDDEIIIIHPSPNDQDSFSQAVSIGILFILALGLLVVAVYFFCLKSDNTVYELSDSSGLDSSSKDRLAAFNSASKKGASMRSRMRYHYRD